LVQRRDPLIAPEILGDIIATASDIAVVISRDGAVYCRC
jgi:hypothetical protein